MGLLMMLLRKLIPSLVLQYLSDFQLQLNLLLVRLL